MQVLSASIPPVSYPEPGKGDNDPGNGYAYCCVRDGDGAICGCGKEGDGFSTLNLASLQFPLLLQSIFIPGKPQIRRVNNKKEVFCQLVPEWALWQRTRRKQSEEFAQ